MFVVPRAHIYSGETVPDDHNLGQTDAIVMNVMDGYLRKGYCLRVNSFYNSVNLTKEMVKGKAYVGSARCFLRKSRCKVTKYNLLL